MEKISLLILHDEFNKEYSFALGKAISNLHRDFDVITLSIDSIDEPPKLNRKMEIILLCGVPQPPKTDGMGHCIRLTEETTGCKELGKAPEMLYKYMKVSELVSEFRLTFAILSGCRLPLNINPDCRIVGFYSAGGGVGKTAAALGIARELSRYHGKKVLYLSFEPFESTAYYVKTNHTAGNIGDFLYYLFHKKQKNVCSFIESFLLTDEYGMETFSPSRGFNELSVLSFADICKLIEEINNYRNYDFVIVDFPQLLDHTFITLLQSCGAMVLVERDETISIEKTDRFLKCLANDVCGSWSGNVIRIRNFTVAERRTEELEAVSTDSESDEYSLISIERHDESFRNRDGIKVIDLDNVFGLSLRKTAKKLME